MYEISALRLSRPIILLTISFKWKSTIEAQSLWNQQIQELPDGYILNLMPVTQTRPDGHWEMTKDPKEYHKMEKRDCLHWCQPGPVDTWALLLYNLIKDLNRVKEY